MSSENATPFQNRIVGTGSENPEQLLAHPNNWRIHPYVREVILGWRRISGDIGELLRIARGDE